MSSLKADFTELVKRIKAGRELGHASFEPIFYLVFSPEQILDVKRQMPAWTAKLKNEGWKVNIFSMATEINKLLEAAPLRKIWLAADAKAPLQWDKTNKALANALCNGALQKKMEAVLEGLETDPKNLLLVTDIEALHPYMRIGAIESRLQGKFSIPTIFFYPGTRTGKTQLKFLGFYPEDGNYRSVHVGG
ncbi:BREX protein BrxB domain-containing protein [uncultured Desulfobacter sp.]|uniref:BREX protein BrxB domain-containing protein n=1 Tax=uncultured Desulfobacter sp. TaxID=240139 RepID=UPI0029C632CF|nr:BREX protein BrxB domain-containing protein [uncultured Desulfobacter sp.]